MAEREALYYRTRGAEAALEIRKEGSKIMGQEAAGYLKSGVLLEGTPLLVMRQTQEDAEKDALDALDAAEFQAEQAETSGRLSQLQAQISSLGSQAQATAYSAQASQLRTQEKVYGALADLDAYTGDTLSWATEQAGTAGLLTSVGNLAPGSHR